MRKLILLIAICIVLQCYTNAQSNPAEQLAQNIATKMKDTLDLTVQQKDSIYTVNMYLHNQKVLVRQQYAGNDSLIRLHTQLVENTRDSLYHPFLSEPKYLLYLEKKRNLVRNN